MSTSTKILGTLPVNREFVEGNLYYKDNIVQYNGSSYICKVTSTTALPTDGTAWRLFAGDGKSRSIINVSTAYNETGEPEVLTIEEATAKIPDSDKVIGFVGTFLTPNGWTTLQYIGEDLEAENWNDPENWKYLVDSAIAQGMGDDETKLMSQKAVTNAINLSELGDFVGPNENIKIKKIDSFLLAFVDKNETLLGGIQPDGKWFIPYGIPEEALAELKAIKNRLDFGESIYKIVSNDNWLFAIQDADSHVIMGYNDMEGWYIPKGIPTDTKEQLKDIRSIIADHYEELRTELTDEINERKAFLHSNDAEEYLWALTDANSNVVLALQKDGSLYQPKGVPTEALEMMAALGERIYKLEKTIPVKEVDGKLLAAVDSKGNQILAIDEDGTTEVAGDIVSQNGMSAKVEENMLGQLVAFVDKDKKMVAAIQEDGKILQGDAFKIGSSTAGLEEKETDGQSLYHIVDKDGKVLFNILPTGELVGSKGVIIDGLNSGIKINEKNLDYLMAVLDANDKLLAAIDNKGALFANSITGVFEASIEDNEDFLMAFEDKNGYILFGVKKDGSFYTTSVEIDGIPGLEESMEFVYVILDKAKKVLFGISNTGRVYYKSGMSEEARSKFREVENSLLSLKDQIDYVAKHGNDLSELEFIHLPIPQVPARIDIEGTIPTSKYLQTKGTLRYEDRLGNKFVKDIMWNVQGSISLDFDKKNFAIDLFNSIENNESCDVKFGNWVAQDSYHIKAYYSDFWKIRSLFGYKVMNEIQASRPTYDRYPWQKHLLGAANQTQAQALLGGLGDLAQDLDTGAIGHPDGFPCMLYINGTPWGLYTVNLKKSKENYHTEKNSEDGSQMFIGDYMPGVFSRFNYTYWTLSDADYTDAERDANPSILPWDSTATYIVGDVCYDEETFDFEFNGQTTSITLRRKFTCATAHGWDPVDECWKRANEDRTLTTSKIIDFNSLKPSRVHWRHLEIRNPKKTICKQTDGSLTFYDYDSPADYAQTGYYERTHEPINRNEYTQSAVTNMISNEGSKFSKKEYNRSVNAYDKVDRYSKIIPIINKSLTNGHLLDLGYITIDEVPTESKTEVDGVVTVSDEYKAATASSTKQNAFKKELFDAYHDIDYAMDFFVIYNAINYYDSITHNTLYHWYDGQHVVPTLYDLDISCGMSSTYTNSWPGVASGILNAGNNTFVGHLWNFHKDDIKARWKQYRDSGIITPENFEKIVWDIVNSIGYENYEEDLTLWTQPSYRKPVYWKMYSGSLKVLTNSKGVIYHGYDETINVENPNYEEWEAGQSYVTSPVASRVNYNGHSYVCTANHTSNADNRPDKAYTCGYPASGGVFDTPRRTIEWLKKRIENLDKSANFNYTA